MNLLPRPRLSELLLATMGLLYGWVGVAAAGGAPLAGAAGVERVLALVGGAAIIAGALLARRARRVALSLLLVGALPLPIVTWWSIVTPTLAFVVFLLAIPVLRPRPAAR